ncbi:response regulator [Roseiconus nitratireducens]|uniref:histidine kinase n=1 Tax=Roseiconus nitratireducens TaxID=2605748 RepID=A0A5M6DE90_9BACT|nr:hybrid sensor histidine kinase/response regulator [Roseiconus nitratireducens]KAA5544602.1 response regulator [Roseiconus nitratireducens]
MNADSNSSDPLAAEPGHDPNTGANSDGDRPDSIPQETRARMGQFSGAIDLLSEWSHSGIADSDESLQETIDMLSKLADSVEMSLSDFRDDQPDVSELVQFVIESCETVRQSVSSDDSDGIDYEHLEILREEIDLRMDSQEYRDDFDSDHNDLHDASSGPDHGKDETDVIAPSQEEIAAMLNGLQSAVADESGGSPSQHAVSDSDHGPSGGAGLSAPPVDQVELDAEIREAFLDDSTRGLESMEQALLDLESNPSDDGPVQRILRELHTIKGASASVGMSHLADYIHDVEELIRQANECGGEITAELLLPHVDLIRARVLGEDPESASPLSGGDQPSGADGSPSSAVRSGDDTTTVSMYASRPRKQAAVSITEMHGDDETVRVKSSKLNRLLDMLSELVMLRNQRDTEISELKGIHDELIHSVTRIRMLSHEGEALLANENLRHQRLVEEGVSFSHLNEVANDVLESAQRLRDCYQPVADGNQAVSQFIRNFRLELVQLRRTPVSGLFRRLHRAISDASRTEHKQVRVELLGENTGIERSLQERIFEPLLHIVRNSVSHGIETPEERTAAGKPDAGVVTLHAHSGPDLLVIEVHDDGRGLDYDAIRRRGIERGLIEGDKSISRAELARLIFHPGFSTRETANQISGRGVGMDVVASTLERMRGWVEVESETGQGSMIRLSLPLPSMIQHAMVFRCGGQLFALPAQSVRRTGECDLSRSPVDLNQLLALNPNDGHNEHDPIQPTMIELASGAASDSEGAGEFALLVDRVLGPEEVVLRPMPPMLKAHPLCIGATLSGMGEVVLLLDPRELAAAAENIEQVVEQTSANGQSAPKEQPKVLVVDDSKSARMRVVRSLEKYPVTIYQADDGQAAMELLSKENIATVFSDIDMPRMSGLELLEMIKNEPRFESIPVVMISSRSNETAGKQSRERGALEYVQKPLTQERFDEVACNLPWAQSTDPKQSKH